MGIAEILSAIGLVVKFFPEVVKFVKLLQGTPEDKRSAVMASIEKESESLRKTGRPL